MKRHATALVALLLSTVAGGAIASAHGEFAQKVRRIDTPLLCYVAANGAVADAVLAREEMLRRDEACTPELTAQGQKLADEYAHRYRLQQMAAASQNASRARQLPAMCAHPQSAVPMARCDQMAGLPR